MHINSENIIKSRISETIIEILLRKSGYQIYPLSLKSVIYNLPSVDQFNHVLNQTGVNSSSFVIVKDNMPDFVKVKFRKDGKLIKNEIKSWSKGYLFLVFPFAPYIKVANMQSFKQDGVLYSVKENELIQINEKALETVIPLVEKYLANK